MNIELPANKLLGLLDDLYNDPAIAKLPKRTQSILAKVCAATDDLIAQSQDVTETAARRIDEVHEKEQELNEELADLEDGELEKEFEAWLVEARS